MLFYAYVICLIFLDYLLCTLLYFKTAFKIPQQLLKITYKPIPDAQGEHVRMSVDIEGVVRATDDGEIGSADGAAEADQGLNHVS